MQYPDYVKVIIDKLTASGYEAYIVGGSLRDMLLGRAPSDFDVTTSALPEEILSVFSDMKTIPTGLKHGTVTVLSEGHPIEVTTFRTDGEYLDSRHPESVSFTRNICEDLARRDFTVNAIAYNDERGIIDPFGGEDDVKNKILRAVGDADERMREDALRIMRALRFSSQLGFSIEENTLAALGRKKDGLANVSRERIGIETAKLLTSAYVENALRIMTRTGISLYVLGNYLPSERIVCSLPTLPCEFFTRFSALLWDCDKAAAREILSSLKYSNAEKNGVISILSARKNPLPSTDAEIRRFIIRHGEHAERAAMLLRTLGEADDELLQRIKSAQSTSFARKISDLDIDGNDLSSLGFGGKDIGEALTLLFEKVTLDPSLNEKEKLISIIKNKDF